MSLMENRERTILDAATQVFLRYGVKRASMGDIATEAGVARQTLYNFYRSKDDILRGSIRLYGLDAMAAIESELPKTSNVGEKIDLVLREMVIKPFVFLHSSPNARDLIEGYGAAGRSEMEANYLSFQSALESILEPYANQVAKMGLSPAILAEIIRRSAVAMKYQAQDDSQVTGLVVGLRSLVVAALDGQ